MLVKKYPSVLKCIPILLAKREKEIFCQDENGSYIYDFNLNFDNIDETKYSDYVTQFSYFMEETGLFYLISERLISNLLDYVTGIEVGLNANARKNRSGHLMENIVEKYIKKAGFIKNETYFKEMTSIEIENKFNVDLSSITSKNTSIKRFDFVLRKNNIVYALECNFYSSSGSKLNETARSYKNIAIASKQIPNFKFIWITDGNGWLNTKHNLEEVFNILDNLYNITDLEKCCLNKL